MLLIKCDHGFSLTWPKETQEIPRPEKPGVIFFLSFNGAEIKGGDEAEIMEEATFYFLLSCSQAPQGIVLSPSTHTRPLIELGG